jgi:hypothetical protein
LISRYISSLVLILQLSFFYFLKDCISSSLLLFQTLLFVVFVCLLVPRLHISPLLLVISDPVDVHFRSS